MLRCFTACPAPREPRVRRPLHVCITALRAAFAIVTLLVLSVAAFAQQGVTVDQWQPAPGQNAEATGIAADASGNLYAAGYVKDSAGTYHFLVRKRNSGESLFSTIKTFQLVAGKNAYAFSVAVDGNGAVYVAGQAHDGVALHWIVRRSVDGGATWTTIDDYQLASGQHALANGIAVSPGGDVFAAGRATGGNGGGAPWWVIRRKRAGETAFRTVDQFQYVSGRQAEASAVAVAPGSGTVYVAGYAYDRSGYSSMFVRKSTDASGGSFVTDTGSIFKLVTRGSASAESIVVNSAGTVYLAGYAYGSNGYTRWTVREGKNGVYSTIRDWQSPSGLWTSARALMLDSQGRLIVAGTYCYATANYHWRVEVGSVGADGNGTSWSAQDWTVLDDYSGEDAITGQPVFANNGAFSLCAFVDPLGINSGLYVAGYGATRDGGEANFLVRKY